MADLLMGASEMAAEFDGLQVQSRVTYGQAQPLELTLATDRDWRQAWLACETDLMTGADHSEAIHAEAIIVRPSADTETPASQLPQVLEVLDAWLALLLPALQQSAASTSTSAQNAIDEARRATTEVLTGISDVTSRFEPLGGGGQRIGVALTIGETRDGASRRQHIPKGCHASPGPLAHGCTESASAHDSSPVPGDVPALEPDEPACQA
jgi:hypothetical protein